MGRSLIAVSRAIALGVLIALPGCIPPADGTRVARSTLVIGIDVSGSFLSEGRY